MDDPPDPVSGRHGKPNEAPTSPPVQDEATEGHAAPRLSRAGAAIRGLAIDITPLRNSRDFRLLWAGELVSLTGRQITIVALAFQVFVQTRSSLAVGLIGLVELVPLVAFSIAGGSIADRMDRRFLLLATELGLLAGGTLLLTGALVGHPPLAYLYVVAGLQAGMMGVNAPTRSAATPNLVGRNLLPAALALNQVMFNTTMILGPAVGGVILARLGLSWAYGIDVVTSTASIGAVLLMRPMPPRRDEGVKATTGWRAIREGFAYLKGKRVLISTFLIDLDAMIFGMPRAVFPVLALTVFHVGPQGLGLLYAAPAAGALIGALTAGWVGRVRHQGRAVIWAVALWGAAITAFGLSGRFFQLSLAFLAFAGAADVISAVFRGTILQLSVPDALRGRLSAIHIMVVTGGPRLGDFEAGAVAFLVSPWFSVVSGGVACLLGVLMIARLFPELGRYHADEATALDQPRSL
jgi:MFS family permease